MFRYVWIPVDTGRTVHDPRTERRAEMSDAGFPALGVHVVAELYGPVVPLALLEVRQAVGRAGVGIVVRVGDRVWELKAVAQAVVAADVFKVAHHVRSRRRRAPVGHFLRMRRRVERLDKGGIGLRLVPVRNFRDDYGIGRCRCNDRHDNDRRNH